jgi:hypothetical protein
MQSDVLKMARESGMTILLDGRIGQQAYMSVSGSTDALQRFAHGVRASLMRRPRRRARAARPPGGNPWVTARMRERIAASLYRGANRPPAGRAASQTPRIAVRRRVPAARCPAE